MDNHHRLGPVVFDEIHKLITDINYRNAFKNFHVLHRVKATLFALTGTFPQHLYPVLCQLTQMTWKVIRTPSWRRELKYKVVKVAREKDMDPAILAHFKQVLPTYRPEDRGIIFCRSKSEAQTLAALLKVQPYHGHQDDDVQMVARNVETMNSWLAGENTVMVSTTILGCGMDYAHIRDVVHRGPSYSIMDQHQEDSRGGRDKLECRAITFIVENKKYPVSNSEYDLGSQKLNESLQNPTICQRTTPSLFLDGVPIQCITLPRAVFCQTCEDDLKSCCSANIPLRVNQEPNANRTIPIRQRTKPHLPPSRNDDLFYEPGPRVDLSQKIRPTKSIGVVIQSSSQTISVSSSSSSRKKRKLTHETMPDM